MVTGPPLFLKEGSQHIAAFQGPGQDLPLWPHSSSGSCLHWEGEPPPWAQAGCFNSTLLGPAGLPQDTSSTLALISADTQHCLSRSTEPMCVGCRSTEPAHTGCRRTELTHVSWASAAQALTPGCRCQGVEHCCLEVALVLPPSNTSMALSRSLVLWPSWRWSFQAWWLHTQCSTHQVSFAGPHCPSSLSAHLTSPQMPTPGPQPQPSSSPQTCQVGPRP